MTFKRVVRSFTLLTCFCAPSGTGASCIYPLLIHRLHPEWKVYASELDEESLEVARRNVSVNCRQAKAAGPPGDGEIVLVAGRSDELLPNVLRAIPRESVVAFCMCNPPFYSSATEIAEKRAGKASASLAAFDYSMSESVFPGGELAFISAIAGESAVLRERITWYTSLVGNKENVGKIERLLRANAVPTIYSFASQAGTTRRWIVAWSYSVFPRAAAARKRAGAPRRARRPFTIETQSGWDGHAAKGWFEGVCKSLLIECICDESGSDATDESRSVYNFECRTTTKSWTRAARRAPLQAANAHLEMRFSAKIIGRALVLELSGDESDETWNDWVSLVNHLRSNVR